MGFAFLSTALGIAFLAPAVAALHGKAFEHASITSLPRARLLGEILGIICLIWSAHHGCMMLEGTLVGLRKFIWIVVPITALLAYGHLDYLFSRALGGILVLCVAALLHGAFAEQIRLRPLYSLVCYLVGISGLLLIGLPWRFRDLLGLMHSSPDWRRRLAVVWLGIGLVFLCMPWVC